MYKTQDDAVQISRLSDAEVESVGFLFNFLNHGQLFTQTAYLADDP